MNKRKTIDNETSNAFSFLSIQYILSSIIPYVTDNLDLGSLTLRFRALYTGIVDMLTAPVIRDSAKYILKLNYLGAIHSWYTPSVVDGTTLTFQCTQNDTVVNQGSTDTFSGVKTFSVQPIFSANTDQIAIQPGGGVNSKLIIYSLPLSAQRKILLSDPGADDAFVYSYLAQALVNKLISNGTFVDANNQIILQPNGSGNKLTITCNNPATTNHTLTLPDPGGNDSFSYLSLAQTLSNKTIQSSTVALANGSLSGYTPSVLDTYEYYTYNATVSGPFASATETCYVQRIGKAITFYFPGHKAAGNNTSTTISITLPPARFLPVAFGSSVSAISLIGQGYDNAVNTSVLIQVPNTGSIVVYKGTGSSFSANTGSTGLDAFGLSWIAA